MTFPLADTERLRRVRAAAEEIAATVAGPNAAAVDRTASWPAASMRALADAGLLGLHVPVRLGGLGQGLQALVAITETLGKGCSSTGLCFGMHCVATAVIAAKATAAQEERFLEPIARGGHVSTLALSEPGTGSHFYLPQTALEVRDGEYVLRGDKQFVTSGGEADSYVVSTLSSDSDAIPGEFNMLVVERGSPGLRWQEPWQGLGMRGNSSRGMTLAETRVPLGNLLGEEGDQIWYVFEIVLPYFLLAMAGTYLGVAQAALDEAVQHVRTRRHSHSGEALADAPLIQHRVAELWGEVEKCRRLVYHAAALGDASDSEALPAMLAAKAEVGQAAVTVTNEAMTLCGGLGYRENGRLARLLRDARAAQVMSPTTDLLRLWTGRTVLGLPLF